MAEGMAMVDDSVPTVVRRKGPGAMHGGLWSLIPLEASEQPAGGMTDTYIPPSIMHEVHTTQHSSCGSTRGCSGLWAVNMAKISYETDGL